MIKKPIGIYTYSDAMFTEYNINNPFVFSKLKKVILKELPFVLIEHIGSTSIINCGGKGIIDLAVLYRSGQLEISKKGLELLGFQKQISTDPFPESWPMRVGSIKWKNKIFKIHAHVIKFGCREHLNVNSNLKNNYEKIKQKILQNGITNSLKYSIEKGKFIRTFILKTNKKQKRTRTVKTLANTSHNTPKVQ